MTWLYSQITGELGRIIKPVPDSGSGLKIYDRVARGYAGRDEHKNNPNSQSIKSKGPLPCGLYYIGQPYNSKTRGPYVLRLDPDPSNNMFGRSAFLIHGDSIKLPGTASNGCIIMWRSVREVVSESRDRELIVVSSNPIPPNLHLSP